MPELMQLDSGKSMMRYFAAVRNGGFGDVAGQRVQTTALTAGEQHRDTLLLTKHSIPPVFTYSGRAVFAARLASYDITWTVYHFYFTNFRENCKGVFGKNSRGLKNYFVDICALCTVFAPMTTHTPAARGDRAAARRWILPIGKRRREFGQGFRCRCTPSTADAVPLPLGGR